MYFTVLGDMRAALSAKEVFVIAKKFFASPFGQSFVSIFLLTTFCAHQMIRLSCSDSLVLVPTSQKPF
jgi:hypothetical protein